MSCTATTPTRPSTSDLVFTIVQRLNGVCVAIDMTLLNLTVLGAHRPHIPWTVVQVQTGLIFSALFSKIAAGTHPRLAVDEELSRSKLDKVFRWTHKGFVKHRGWAAHHRCLVNMWSSQWLCPRLAKSLPQFPKSTLYKTRLQLWWHPREH
jgi:hypothetical protein